MTHFPFGLLMAPAEGGSPVALFVQLGLIFMIFYWLLIRPQKKEKDRHKAMIETLKKGGRDRHRGWDHRYDRAPGRRAAHCENRGEYTTARRTRKGWPGSCRRIREGKELTVIDDRRQRVARP